MLRRSVGLVLIVIGLAAVVVGGVGSLLPVSRADVTAEPDTSSSVPASSSTASSSSPTTVGVTTTTSPTTTSAVDTTTTTTAAPVTTTTVAPVEAIALFIEEFGSAIASEDVDWLLDRLHSAMILGYGEDVCRTFITNEILLLTSYTLSGGVSGPVSKTLETGVGSVTVEGIYEADVSFVFRGDSFASRADFVLDDTVTWLATCR